MVWGAYRAKAQRGTMLEGISRWSVRKKLMLSMLPLVLVILVFTGYVTNWYSTRYLTQALERTTQVQNLAQVHEIEQLYDSIRLIELSHAQGALDKERLLSCFRQLGVAHPRSIREVAFIGQNPADSILLVNTGHMVLEIARDHFNFVKNSPVVLPAKARDMKKGQVLLSELTETTYPPSAFPDSTHGLGVVVLRFIAPSFDSLGILRGHLVVSLDAVAVRNILSLYNSPKSPLYSFPRTSENRFSFYLDDQGWMLFQSENYEEPDKELTLDSARLGLTGDYGMPEFEKAFRPSPRHESFWRMVVSIQSGRHGVEDADPIFEQQGGSSSQHFVAYAPVRFQSHPDREPEIVSAVAYVDRSRLTDAAEFRHLDVMTIITVCAIGLVSGIIVFISRVITRPILTLASEMSQVQGDGALRPIELPASDRETTLLKHAINALIQSVQEQGEQIRRRDAHIRKEKQRQKVSFDDEIPEALGWRLVGEAPDLIGASAPMLALQANIRKSASSNADVLVIGETGTGKELAAEAIHKFSERSTKPFISINCGGLDENLLLDALFGHVKGAFTEARKDRKGAFMAADGGTLFLDEIGTASAKVQKALLRALSVRRIRPLGSDNETEFNVRVIAATNADLPDLVKRGEFREDLYYRLKVITITTPALRQRKEDIPLLANFFLKESMSAAKRAELSFSRGALDKLTLHDWPGNVRELKNCITRAVAMVEGALIFAEDLIFDERLGELPEISLADLAVGMPLGPQEMAGEPEAGEPQEQTRPAESKAAAAKAPAPEPEQLHPRQRRALELARSKGSFGRGDYQELLGADISQRTAQYDLQHLVKGGYLVKRGKGPATQYSLPESGERRTGAAD